MKAVRQTFITRGWSRNYINTSCRRIIRMFRWGAAEGMISPDDPQALAMVPGLRKGKSEARETAPVPPVSTDVVDATLPHLPEVVADMVHIQRLTGARPNEICILRPCDVDRSHDIWEYRPHSHKTQYRGRDRVTLIGPKAQRVLLRYLARSHDDFCFRPADSEAKRRAAAHSTRVTQPVVAPEDVADVGARLGELCGRRGHD
jgi:integrase